MTRLYSGLLLISSLMLSACSSNYSASSLEEKYTTQASNFVTVDGNRIHYRDEGRGPVVVLIHGTASSLHTWDAWSKALTSKYRVIRMDLPGFGLTGPDRLDRYEVADDVHFLAQFLDKLAIDKAHFAGSSLGGRIAWQYALEYPDKVVSLTLMNSLGYPQASWPPPIEMGQWPVVDTIMENFSPRFMYEIGLKDVYYDQSLVNDTLVDRYYELSRYPGNMAAFPKRVKARLDKDSQAIPNIQVPTLIQWGEEDQYFPVASAYRFNNEITNSVLHVYKNVGHLPMEETPETSVKHFASFIASITSGD